MWTTRHIGKCGCGRCGDHWNVYKEDGTQIPGLSESDAKLIAAAPEMRDFVQTIANGKYRRFSDAEAGRLLEKITSDREK